MTECSETRFRLAGAAIVAVVAFVAFAPSLGCEFAYDDVSVVGENPEISNLLNLKTYFTRDYFVRSGEATYRPLVTASYGLDYLLWGKNPVGYHLTNLLWHAAGCIAFFFLCVSLRATREIAVVASSIYAAHPVLSESVIGIGFREDLLCATFFFAALALWPGPEVAPKPRVARRLRFSGAMVLYVLALLSKEMALSFPLMALAKDLRLRRLSRIPKLTSLRKPTALPHALVWAITLGALALFLTFSVPQASAHAPDNAGLAARLAAFASISLRYVRLFLVPYPLCIDYVIRMNGDLFWWTAAGSVATLLLFAALAWRVRRAFPAAAESLIAFCILLLPVSDAVRIFNPMAERYLTIPAVALAWIASHLLGSIAWRRARWLATTFIVLACCFLSWVRVQDWRHPARLWLGAIQLGNETARTAHNLGAELYYAHGRLDEVIGWYYRAVALDPGYYKARLNLSQALIDKKMYAEAIENCEVILRFDPSPRPGDTVAALAHNNIGLSFYRLGDTQKAFDHFDEALKIVPRLREPYNNRGSILAEMGRYGEAAAQFAKAIESDPYWEVPHLNLARSLRQEGRFDEALDRYRIALRLNPNHARARLELARLLADCKRTDEALEEYGEVLRIAPDDSQAARELNALLGRSREWGK